MRLLAGTVSLRPYVFAFLAAGLWAARRDLDRRGAVAAAAAAFGVGLGFDLASTRWGLPFGGYTYSQATRGRELFVSNVPLFTPLSYVFLGWVALGAARWAGRLWLAPVIFTWMDVVVDPVTVRGGEWFLGQVFRYRSSGQYFGVPLSNFGGWLLLGSVVTAAYAAAARGRPPPTWRSVAVVGGVVAFALAVAGLIGAWALVGAGATQASALAALLSLPARASWKAGSHPDRTPG